MDHRPLHIHSMLVHAVIAFAPLAAVSFVLDASAATVVGIDPGVWRLLLWVALVGMLAVALPAATFRTLIDRYMGGKLRGPFNWPARIEAGFSAAELSSLEQAL